MSADSLTRLTIAHLRGSVVEFVLPFDKNRKLTIVYGENATGKSTICDAFEFLGKGKVSSLEKRGLGQTTRYWPSLSRSLGDISVVLETSKGPCKATMTKAGVVIDPPERRPAVEVLRKNQILSLMEAKPADRYAAVSRFIDVSGIEAAEAGLRDLIRDLEGSRHNAAARVQENELAVHQFWEIAGRPLADKQAWALREISRDQREVEEEVDALGRLQRSFTRLEDYPNLLKQGSTTVEAALKSVASAEAKVADCLARIGAESADTVAVLGAAVAYLDIHAAPEICPLCESGDRALGLKERVARRLARFTELRAAQEADRQARNELEHAKRQLEANGAAAVRYAAAFEEYRLSRKWASDIAFPQSAAPAQLAQLVPWIEANAPLVAQWKRAEASRYDNRKFVGTLRGAFKTWRDNVQAQEELDALIPRLARALVIVESERKAFTDEVLSGIATEVGRLYEDVHPGEGLNKISLQLDPKKRGSLEIEAEFCGKTAAPGAYFSDSHLDTLGLCVFLALAGLEMPQDTILVLDDVLASVDEPHVDRLIDMLAAEVAKFRHCLITTHYRPWKQKFRWGWLQIGPCHFIELSKWTVTEGLGLVRSVPDVERLRLLLADTPPDMQLVCAKAGVILEAALDFLTLLYECSVPRKTGGYTLGELLPAIDKKLRNALRVEVASGKDAAGVTVYVTSPLGPILDELARIAQVRNVFGCHFSELSFDLLESEAVVFANEVIKLVTSLTDSEAGWPRNNKSGEFWATTGQTRRLYPLKHPG